MKLKRLMRMALVSIWTNKIRSLLTMLGIIIGISSVIVLVGLGEGTKQQIQSQIESLGTNLITVSITGRRSITLSTEDLDELRTKPPIKQIAPLISQNSINIKAGTVTGTTSLEASIPEYAEVRKVNLTAGRFITKRDVDNRYNVAVVGVDVANTLFKSTNVVGQNFSVNGVNFQIIGVIEPQGSSMGGSGDDRIIVPLTTGQRLLKSSDVRSFYIEALDKDSVEPAKGYLQLLLNKKYKNDTSNYRIFDQTSLLNTVNQTATSMTALLSGIAAISLVVGGIGIMNIMLVSVIERTREIGIRKAIGAKRINILTQFLIEASGISFVGGIIGVLFGYIIANIVTKFISLPVSISFNVVLAAVLFSAFVGISFGMYPANKASKLNPIDALRFE